MNTNDIISISNQYRSMMTQLTKVVDKGLVRYSSPNTRYQKAAASRYTAELVLQGTPSFAVKNDELVITSHGQGIKLFVFLDDLS